ncbi:MAG: MarR family winged helix-turn-helix transcriptional regulator [Polyangiales bacterium]
MSTRAEADEFAELFPAIYLRFHLRDGKQSELPSASRAVLQHLSQTGPLTIGEAAAHLERAQSVVSEIVDHLEEKGLLERMRDPRDKRRTLVWLTDEGLARLAKDREVLSRDALARAMSHMHEDDRRALVRGVRALIEADDRASLTKEPS